MKIETQVISIEQAKRLKELGIAQESLFNYWSMKWWQFEEREEIQIIYHEPDERDDFSYTKLCSAFTVAELGVMLPMKEYNFHTGIATMANNNEFYIGFGINNRYATTESECRAAMLIYLLEQNLITAGDCNKRLGE